MPDQHCRAVCVRALCADSRTRTPCDCCSFHCAVVVAVGSRVLQKAKDFIEETSSDSAKPYGSYEEVLEDENVHGVYIPLPTSLHLEWVKKVADKGKHILLEKPIALVSQAVQNCKNFNQNTELCIHLLMGYNA